MPERLTPSELERVRNDLFTELRRWLEQHELRDEARFDTIRTAQVEIQQILHDMNGKVGRMNAEIGYGLPEPEERNGRPTLRDRLHTLEDAKHAATAAGAALGLLFGRITRWFVVVGIVVAAVTSLLRLLGVGG